LKQSAGKLMMIVFWNVDGVILTDFLPKVKKFITSVRYHETLMKLVAAICCKRPVSQNIILCHDDKKRHTAHATVAAIEAKGWATSSDIHPRPWFIWFSSIWTMKELPCHCRTEIELRKLRPSWLLYNRGYVTVSQTASKRFIGWKTCRDKQVNCNGDYIQKLYNTIQYILFQQNFRYMQDISCWCFWFFGTILVRCSVILA